MRSSKDVPAGTHPKKVGDMQNTLPEGAQGRSLATGSATLSNIYADRRRFDYATLKQYADA